MRQFLKASVGSFDVLVRISESHEEHIVCEIFNLLNCRFTKTFDNLKNI